MSIQKGRAGRAPKMGGFVGCEGGGCKLRELSALVVDDSPGGDTAEARGSVAPSPVCGMSRRFNGGLGSLKLVGYGASFMHPIGGAWRDGGVQGGGRGDCGNDPQGILK